MGSVGLVEGIAEAFAHAFVLAGGEGGGDGAGVADIEDGVAVGDGGREDASGVFGEDLHVGDEEDEFETFVDWEAEGFAACVGEDEAAEGSWAGVVWVAFDLAAEGEETVAGEGIAAEFVEGGEDAEADGDAAAEASADGDIAGDGPLEAEFGDIGAAEEEPCAFPEHGVGWVDGEGGADAGDGEPVVEGEGDAEAIEAWSDVGRAAGDLDGDGGRHRGRVKRPMRRDER